MMIQLFRLHERNECDKRLRDGAVTIPQAVSRAEVRASRLLRPLAPDHRPCSSASTPQTRHLSLTAFPQPLQTGIAHLGAGANHAPVAEHLQREFAAEIEKARQDEDDLPRQSDGSHDLAGVHCDNCGELIRAEDYAELQPLPVMYRSDLRPRTSAPRER
jgi:hypothetical protein